MFMKLKTILLSVVVITIFASCSAKKSSSSIEINFQTKGVSSQSLSAEDIGLIIVNISGPGIENKIVAQKECDDGELCNSISIDNIPSGSSRLIQLLVITKEDDEVGGSGVLYYGDVSQELSGSAEVPIKIEERANFANESRFTGHYLPKVGHALAGKFLTGELQVNVFVGLNKPMMTIGTSEIFGGWYDLFLLDNVRFKFIFTGWDFQGNKHEKVEVFNDVHSGLGLNIAKVLEGATSTNNKIANFNYSGQVKDGDSLRRFESRIVAALGASQKRLCYDSVSSFDGSSGSNQICKDLNCTNYLAWSDLTKSMSDGVAQCPDPMPQTGWVLNTKKLNDKGAFSGFMGPFSNGGDGLESIMVSSTDVKWRLDNKTKLSGVHVFTRATAGFDEDLVRTSNLGDGYDCSKLASHGFSNPKTGTQMTGFYQYNFSATEQSAFSNGNLSVFLCPVRPDGKYFETAYVHRDHFQDHSNALRFAVYDNSGAPIAGYEIDGSGWQSSIKPSFEAIAPAGSTSLFVEVKNEESQKVWIETRWINYNHSDANLAIEGSALTPPSGLSPCSNDSTIELDPNESCVFRIDFQPVTSGQRTYHDGFTLNFTTDLSHYYQAGFDFIAPVYGTFNFSGGVSNHDLLLHAHESAPYDVHYVKIINSTAGSLDLDAAMSSVPNVTATTCGSIISGANCIIKLEYLFEAGDTDTSYTSMYFDGSYNLNVGVIASEVTLSGGSPFDFGTITNPNTAITGFNLTNPSSSETIYFSSINQPGNNFIISNNTCGSSLSPSAMCSVAIEAGTLGAPTEAFEDRQWLVIYHSFNNNTFRILERELVAYFQ